MVIVPREFLGCADDRRFKPGISAHRFNATPQCRVGDVLKIPSRQVLYAMHRSDGDMQSVSRFRFRDCTSGHQVIRQIVGLVRDFEKRYEIDLVEAFIRSDWIASLAFIPHHLGNHETKSRQRQRPPTTRQILTG